MKEWTIYNPGMSPVTAKGARITLPNKEHPVVVVLDDKDVISAIAHLAPGGTVTVKGGQ